MLKALGSKANHYEKFKMLSVMGGIPRYLEEIQANLSADEKKIKKIVNENQPAYYLVKLDWSLSAIIEKAKIAVLAQ